MMDDVKDEGKRGDSNEHLASDLKSITNTVFAIKSSLHKEI